MINTLVALVAALTIGTITLMIMETDPIRPKVRSLIAASAPERDPLDLMRQTDTPLKVRKWRNVVVYSAPIEGDRLQRSGHFFITREEDPQIQSTNLWKQQQTRNYISGPNSAYNDKSIVVCVQGRSVSEKQLQTLISLVRSLQFDFQVTRGRVYLLRELDPSIHSPKQTFPTARFNARLLRLDR